MRWLALSLCLLAAGCYERRMNAWVGHPYGELVRTWGTPTTRHRAPDGGTILTWEDAEIDQGGYKTCRRSFTTDRGGRVVRWAIAGCDWRTTHIPQPPSD
jgi:hypothetical protein